MSGGKSSHGVFVPLHSDADRVADAAHTIRVKLLKIGATIVRVLLASHHPLRALFVHAARALAP